MLDGIHSGLGADPSSVEDGGVRGDLPPAAVHRLTRLSHILHGEGTTVGSVWRIQHDLHEVRSGIQLGRDRRDQTIALVGAPAVILATTGFIEGLTIPIYNINQVSLRQAITPDRVQGRMNATMRTIVWGTIPVGAFIGGILGTSIGLVQTLVLGGFVSLLAALWIFLGPVIRLKEQPAPVMA